MRQNRLSCRLRERWKSNKNRLLDVSGRVLRFAAAGFLCGVLLTGYHVQASDLPAISRLSGADHSDSSAPAVTSGGENQQYIWEIAYTHGIHVYYLSGLNYMTGSRIDAFRLVCDREEDLIVNFVDFYINDTILTDVREQYAAVDQEAQDHTQDVLTQSILHAEQAGITVKKLTGTIQIADYIRNGEDHAELRVIEEVPVTVSFPENWRPGLVCEEAYGMKAEKQVLGDDGVQIALLGCGKYLGGWGGISGILCLENHVGETRSYRLSGAEINGETMDLISIGDRYGELPEGTAAYLMFYIQDMELEASGITSVNDLRLQILTDATQSTGTKWKEDGGAWYSAALSKSREPEELFEPGEPVYEDEWIQIGYTGGAADWHESEYGKSHGTFEWNLSVVNKSDENLELKISDASIDGKSADQLENKPYLEKDSVGANAKRKMRICQSMEENAPLPEISFRIQVRKQGGGVILGQSEEQIVLNEQ